MLIAKRITKFKLRPYSITLLSTSNLLISPFMSSYLRSCPWWYIFMSLCVELPTFNSFSIYLSLSLKLSSLYTSSLGHLCSSFTHAQIISFSLLTFIHCGESLYIFVIALFSSKMHAHPCEQFYCCYLYILNM